MAVLIKPRNNYLLVRRYERPEQTEGGLHIPESFRIDKSGWLWEVVDTGPGALTKKGARVPCECQPGDLVHTDTRWVAQALDTIDPDLYLLSEDYVSHVVWRPS